MPIFNEECRGHNKEDFNSELYIKNSGITYSDSSYRITRDKSDTTIIEYVINGKGYIEIGNKSYTVHKGDLYILRRGQAHSYYADKNNPYTKIWINVKGDFIDYLLSIYNIYNNPYICACNAYDKIKDIHNIINTNDKSIITLSLPLAIHKLIAVAANSDKGADYAVNKVERKGITMPEIVMDYINAHIQEKLNLNDLCDKYHISKPVLIKLFKDRYNITPYNYYLKEKLEFAKVLLKNTDISLEDIAQRLYFTSRHHLTNAFKNAYGLTPVQYRKNNNSTL